MTLKKPSIYSHLHTAGWVEIISYSQNFSSADVWKEKKNFFNVGQEIPCSSGNCSHKYMEIVVLGISNFLLLYIDILKQEFLISFLNILPTEL